MWKDCGGIEEERAFFRLFVTKKKKSFLEGITAMAMQCFIYCFLCKHSFLCILCFHFANKNCVFASHCHQQLFMRSQRASGWGKNLLHIVDGNCVFFHFRCLRLYGSITHLIKKNTFEFVSPGKCCGKVFKSKFLKGFQEMKFFIDEFHWFF
jgi:hypothetical protein